MVLVSGPFLVLVVLVFVGPLLVSCFVDFCGFGACFMCFASFWFGSFVVVELRCFCLVAHVSFPLQCILILLWFLMFFSDFYEQGVGCLLLLLLLARVLVPVVVPCP